MEIAELDSSSYYWADYPRLRNLCTEAINENLPASKNMTSAGWRLNSASLLYLLYEEKRFDPPNGKLFVVYDNNQIVAVSGVYISDFNKYVAIGGVRTWTRKEYRTKYLHGKYLIPAQIEWAKAADMKMFALTFNDYNEWLPKFISRGKKGKATSFGLGFCETYKDFVPHDTKLTIKNVEQYVLKMPLEEGFDIDDVGQTKEIN